MKRAIWKIAPAWARYIVDDSLGRTIVFEAKPEIRDDRWVHLAGTRYEIINDPREDWMDSLEEKS